jgi:hypothetical protein
MRHPDGTLNYMQWVHVGQYLFRSFICQLLISAMSTDHCIEVLRETVSCFSDTSAYNYQWFDGQKRIVPKLQSMHMCRDFGKLQNWTQSQLDDSISTSKHVEGGEVVDYSGFNPEPEALVQIAELRKALTYDLRDL